MKKYKVINFFGRLIKSNNIHFWLSIINHICCLCVILILNNYALSNAKTELTIIKSIKNIGYLIIFLSLFINSNIIIGKTSSLKKVFYSIGIGYDKYIKLHLSYLSVVMLISSLIELFLFILFTDIVQIGMITYLQNKIIIIIISYMNICYLLHKNKSMRNSLTKRKEIINVNNTLIKITKNSKHIKNPSLFLSIRYLLSNYNKSIIFIALFTSINILFTLVGSSLKAAELKGTGRPCYKSDYQLKIPFNSLNNSLAEKLINEIYSIEDVKLIVPQYSIIDNFALRNSDKKMYNYYSVLKDKNLNSQSKKFLSLCNTLNFNGNITDNNHVVIGITAFDRSGLELLNEFIIEGNLIYNEVITKPIIFLPKFINYFENIELTYTNLNVGDSIKVLEINAEGGINNEYYFTIGGYIDNLVFDQYNGVSNGFVFYMSKEQMMNLATDYKYIVSLNIDVENKSNRLANDLQEISSEYGMLLIDNENEIYNRNIEVLSKVKPMAIIMFILILVFFSIIFLTIYVSDIFQRQNEYIIFNIIGATKRHIFFSLLYEVFIILICGFILGISFGIVVFYLLNGKDSILMITQMIPWSFIVTNVCMTLSLFFLIILSCYIYLINNINNDVNIDNERRA